MTAAPQDDLEAIRSFIAADNPTRAASFVDELLERCESLADAPETFPLVARYERHGIRRRVHRHYLIFYRITGPVVDVLHILHGARDYDALLFPD